MNLIDYLKQPDSGTQKAFADKIGISQVSVSHWANFQRPVPIEHCALIEQLTHGLVTRQELRPLDWARIWPELAEKAAI
jgi:DNA-binding transcriptional regulator YdaS (Cro superfamily)